MGARRSVGVIERAGPRWKGKGCAEYSNIGYAAIAVRLGWSRTMPLSLKRERLLSLLAAAGSKRIAVVGDAMLDVYLRGDVERISPEAPVPVVRIK